MTIRGHVQGGVIVLEAAAELPEGAEVEVRVLAGPAEVRRPNPELLKYSGVFKDLPPDASTTIDRVLYGKPPE